METRRHDCTPNNFNLIKSTICNNLNVMLPAGQPKIECDCLSGNGICFPSNCEIWPAAVFRYEKLFSNEMRPQLFVRLSI